MSSVMEFASQETHENSDDQHLDFDFILHMDLTAANLSLPNETVLRAAISLKDKVCLCLCFVCYQNSEGRF